MIAITACGCSKDPFLPTITFAVPANFEAAKSTKPAHVSRWWARFGSEELNRLMTTADFENLDIAIAVAQLRESEAQIDIAGAALWPQLTYSDNNQRSQSSGTSIPGIIAKPVARNSFSKVVNASYVVDIWGQNRATLEAAIRTATASAYQVEVVRIAARANVVNNYLLHAANWERVGVAQRNLTNAERVLRVIRERQSAGTASELDVVQEVTLVEQQRASIPLLRQAAEQARVALAVLIGLPAQAVQLSGKKVRALKIPPVSPGLPSELIVRRPDVHQAEEQLASADANVEVARKALLPTITLTGQAGVQSALLSTLLRPESFIYSVAAGLTQPIFDGGRLRAQVRLSEAQRQQLLETYRRSIVTALTDVETALIAVREEARREAAQQAAVVAARRAFELSEARLNQGTIDITQLLATQNTLFQAEDLLIQVRLSRLQAIAQLYQALGGDWQEPVIPTSHYTD
ncbi:MAG: TolC family protein [Proteobacteria bacterium]|nr:TolC family protein [Pseudomonadota bacterium]